MKRLFALLVIFGMLAGCTPVQDAEETATSSNSDLTVQAPSLSGAIDTEDLFSERDLRQDYEAAHSAEIVFEGNSIRCSSDAVQIDGSTATITDEGVYVLSGTLDDGMVIVNADKQDKVQLVLNGVSINSSNCAPIYVLQADKVFLTLADGSENTLSNGGCFEAIDENNIDSVVFSKENLTINGSGQISIQSPAGHGIVSKDELTITGGILDITSAAHGITGKDNVCVAGGSFTIAAGKDGIHAENSDDPSLGFVYIQEGSFTIDAQGDGISAGAQLQLDGGNYNIVTGGGSENGEQHTSSNWGGPGGGMGGPGGGMGGPGGWGGGRSGGGSFSFSTQEATEDSTSIKGIKAGGAMIISGGSYTLNCADDAIHSNVALTVSGGSFQIATGDDGLHADGALLITGSLVHITESYEGLEGLSITIAGGDIQIVSDDDGLNAAGGTDQSGFGGIRGDQFGGGSSDSFIRISGGKLFINASGDGIDSNGFLEISGGHTTVTGPTNGDTAVLDYDTNGTISGGTFIGTGANMMAQTLESTTEQGVFAVSINGSNATAGTVLTLTDSQGRVVISYEPNLSFGFIVLSSPDIRKGETYTITVGDISGSFEAN